MNVLVTGGAGFIGSHTVVELINSGHKPVIVDSLINSELKSIYRIEGLSKSKLKFYNEDVRNTKKLVSIMEENNCSAVIHFAALKAVGESVSKPIEYYDNNINGTLSVLKAMKETKAIKLVFSSSATVYGDPDSTPIIEQFPLKTATNPYGATKQFCEKIIIDTTKVMPLHSVLLRYFNPIGAHPSGLIGELPIGTPNNLVPFVTQTAAGQRKELTIYGNDYDTSDGTGVRDYIHVVDLAKAHVKSLEKKATSSSHSDIYNIGTGKGVSVLEIIKTFEKINGVKVPYKIGERRQGDIAACYADVKKANNELGWSAKLTIEDALRDAWNWQKNLV